MITSRVLVAGLLVVAMCSQSRAETIDYFGLHHTTLGQANFATNIYSYGLTAVDIRHFGDDGIATELGEADSGVFIYPYVSSVSDGYFMQGRAYGSVNGQSNSLIGTVSGRREEYATFFLSADFSAIGATNLTFQLWDGGVLVAESTAPSGEVRLFTESYSRPRANPWCRQTNGEYGASIELRFPSLLTLPDCTESNCTEVYASRIFIRPNGATGAVDFVSRSEVFGGGGLPDFNFNEVWLGMFHRPHAALGDAKLVANNGMLTMAEIPLDSENGGGVVAEFDAAARAQIDFQPIDLAIPNTNGLGPRLEVSASGTFLNSFGNIGSLTLLNTNGVLELSGYVYDELAATLQVFSNNLLVGSSPLVVQENVRIDGAPRVTSAGATSDSLEKAAGLSFGFETNATFTFTNGTQLVGNKVVLHGDEPLRFADVKGVSILAHGMPSFTIVAESSEAIVPPQLNISLSNGTVFLRWPDPARAFTLEYKPVLDTYFTPVETSIEYSNGVTTAFFSLSESEMGFFRLNRYSY